MLKNIKKAVRTFAKDESGQGMIEYVILAALLVIVVIVIVRTVGKTMEGKFDKINKELKKG